MNRIIAGLVGVVIGAIGTWELQRRRTRGNAVHYFSSGRPRPWPKWPKPPSIEELEQAQLRQNPLLLVDRSPLVRAIGVGQTRSGDGVTIECVAVEIREVGGRALLRTIAPAGGLHGPWREGHAPVDPTPQLEDDRGTTYAVSMHGWTGGDRAAEVLFRFAPSPPAEARHFMVRAPRTPPFGLPSGVTTDGFWEFEVDLVEH